MKRTHAWPKGHWGWLIPVTHKHGLRCGRMIFVGGQVDKDTKGLVLHPGDVRTQTRVVVGHIRTVLTDLGAGLDDVVRLVAFYVNDGRVDEGAFLADVAAHLAAAPGPVVTVVPVPYLAYPGMLVEIEAMAMLSEDGARLGRSAPSPAARPWPLPEPFSHGLRCGEMIFVGGQTSRDATGAVRYPGDLARQGEVVLEGVSRVIADHGAALDDAVKLTVYYVGAGAREQERAVTDLLARRLPEPGPVVTAVPVPWLPDGLRLEIEAVAMRAEDGARLPRRHVAPEGRRGLRCGEMVFVAAQVACDARGEPVDPGRLVAQTHTVMGRIRTVLAGLDLSLDDVVKVNAYFKSGGTAEELNANLRVRSACFTEPGPATTGIPLPSLADPDLMIEVEVIAMAPSAGAGARL